MHHRRPRYTQLAKFRTSRSRTGEDFTVPSGPGGDLPIKERRNHLKGRRKAHGQLQHKFGRELSMLDVVTKAFQTWQKFTTSKDRQTAKVLGVWTDLGSVLWVSQQTNEDVQSLKPSVIT